MRGRRERLREGKQGNRGDDREKEAGNRTGRGGQTGWARKEEKYEPGVVPLCLRSQRSQETEAEGLQDLMTEASLACIVRPLCPPGPQKRLS